MIKAICIQNPKAHSGQLAPEIDAIRATVSAQLKEALHLDEVEWQETQYPLHGRQLAEDAVRNGFQYVFAGGGDGTINEVLNGIMGLKLPPAQRPVFGVLPLGTSNDFFAAMKSAEAARTKDAEDNLTLALDVGHVLFDDVERYFCLTSNIGLFSWANELYLAESVVYGRRFAHIPAMIRAVLSYRFLPNVRITRDEKHLHVRRILTVVISNSPVVGGGTPITPDAKIDDGQLDICIIKPISLLRLAWLAVRIRLKAHTRSRSVELGRIREITITSKQALPVTVDGELVPEIDSKARRMVIHVIPHALRIVIPSICEIAPRPSGTPLKVLDALS